MEIFIPYCGIAPAPGSASWNTDPVLACVLIIAAVGYWRMAHTNSSSPNYTSNNSASTLRFYAGLAVFAFALISPLCNLSVALFSARSAQHLLVAFVAAPLLASGLSVGGGIGKPGPGMSAALVFAATFWFWHAPGAYDVTLSNNVAYWAMQATILVASVWLWSAVLQAAQLMSLMLLFFTTMQMGLLGAILTFAPRVFYTAHAQTTHAWGLTAHEDQMIGGLIMWIVAGLLMAIYSLAALVRVLNDGGGGVPGEKAAPLAGRLA